MHDSVRTDENGNFTFSFDCNDAWWLEVFDRKIYHGYYDTLNSGIEIIQGATNILDIYFDVQGTFTNQDSLIFFNYRLLVHLAHRLS